MQLRTLALSPRRISAGFWFTIVESQFHRGARMKNRDTNTGEALTTYCLNGRTIVRRLFTGCKCVTHCLARPRRQEAVKRNFSPGSFLDLRIPNVTDGLLCDSTFVSKRDVSYCSPRVPFSRGTQPTSSTNMYKFANVDKTSPRISREAFEFVAHRF